MLICLPLFSARLSSSHQSAPSCFSTFALPSFLARLLPKILPNKIDAQLLFTFFALSALKCYKVLH